MACAAVVAPLLAGEDAAAEGGLSSTGADVAVLGAFFGEHEDGLLLASAVGVDAFAAVGLDGDEESEAVALGVDAGVDASVDFVACHACASLFGGWG